MMEKSISDAQDALREMGGLEGVKDKLQEVMEGMSKLGAEGLEGLLSGLGEEPKELLSNLFGEGADDMEGEMREHLARMLSHSNHDREDPTVDIDEF